MTEWIYTLKIETNGNSECLGTSFRSLREAMTFDFIHHCQYSDKLQATDFLPKYLVATAIEEVIEKNSSGELVDQDQCYMVR